MVDKDRYGIGNVDGNKRNINADIKSNDIFDLKTLFSQRQDILWDVLHERYKYNTSIQNGQNFLYQHIDSKLPLIIMYADLVGSTKMSVNLPVEKMAMIIKIFSHEISSVIESFKGLVLKYAGDAVIAFFPVGFNKYLSCDKSFRCAKSILNVIEKGINPILKKEAYPKLEVKLSMDQGECIVIQYGFDKSAPMDLIGYPLNVAAKMNSLTEPNKISVGNNIFKFLHPSMQIEFKQISVKENEWKYTEPMSRLLYKIYST